MKVAYDKRSKDPIYYIQEGYRDTAGKSTTRNVKKVGRHSQLLAQGIDDPLAYAKEIAKEMTAEKDASKKQISYEIDFDQNLPFNKESSLSSTSFKMLNIGYFYLQSIYNDLHIITFFKNCCKSPLRYDTINRFLVFKTILDPENNEDFNFFYEQPEIRYHNVHRFNTFLEKHKNEYEKYIENYSHNIQSSDHDDVTSLINQTAKIIVQQLMQRLKDNGYKIKRNDLIRTLRNMCIINEHNIFYQAMYTNSLTLEALENCFPFGLQKEYHQAKTLNATLRKITVKK